MINTCDELQQVRGVPAVRPPARPPVRRGPPNSTSSRAAPPPRAAQAFPCPGGCEKGTKPDMPSYDRVRPRDDAAPARAPRRRRGRTDRRAPARTAGGEQVPHDARPELPVQLLGPQAGAAVPVRLSARLL